MGDGSGKKRQLGKILLRQKLVTQVELDDLLDIQKAEPGHRLASVAVEAGKVATVDMLKALSEQHGLPGIDLEQVVIPLANLKLIPAEIAKRHLILPILVKDDRIFLAMADPGDRRVIDEIEFVTGRRVFAYVALHEPLTEVIDQTYRMVEQGEDYFVGPRVPADYLRSLGLDKPDSIPPDPMPGQRRGVVVDRDIEDQDLDDGELGLGVPLEPEAVSVQLDPIAETSPGRVSASRTPKVLVVDDEDDIRRLLRRVLTEQGYDVVEASKGLEALQKVRSEVPDVILLDAMLPEVHGFDICRRIKGSKRYGHIPIIMVSAVYRGWRFAEDLKSSYGVEVFLEKPFKIAEVLSWVARALEGRASEPAREEDDELSREAADSLARGLEAYQHGDLDAAIAFLEAGLGIDPLSFKLHYHLGLLYGRRDNLFEAIHELETAVDLSPSSFPVLKNLAVLYQRAGFKHKAIEMWERALANAPDEETRQGIKDHLMSLL